MRPILRPVSVALAVVVLATGCGGSRPHPSDTPWNLAPVAQLPLRIAPDLVVRRVRFGVLESEAGGGEHFRPVTELSPQEGVNYGWIVDVETTRPTLHWQERLRLPEREDDWGDALDDPDITLSEDGRSAYSTGSDLVEDGKLQRFYWSLAQGDPAGTYEMDVAIEGYAVAHLEFRVPKAVHEKPILVHHRLPRGQAPVVHVVRVDARRQLLWK
jgi:hypothetical protein